MSQEFTLSQVAPLGEWVITISVHVRKIHTNIFYFCMGCFLLRLSLESIMESNLLLYNLSSSLQGVTDRRVFYVDDYGNQSVCFNIVR